MDADSIIRFKELTFGYGPKTIINNLSFNIPKGRVVAIMGGSGVGKTASEISDALDAHIGQFNVESESELALLAEIAVQKGVDAPVSLRVNPDVDAKTHEKISTGRAQDKFGINLDKAAELFFHGSEMNGITMEGLAIHIGSQLREITPFEDAFKTVGILCKKLREGGQPIDRIDLGGGLGISYDGKDELTLSSYGNLVKRTARELGTKIVLEPGRWMVGPAGAVITRVIRMKSQGNKNFAIVDMAMNDLLRPALYGAWHNIEPIKANSGDPKELVDFVGPICESGDIIGVNRPVTGLEVNDLVVVRDAGAYGAVMSSNYNSRLTAAEIIVNGDKTDIIRPRLTYESMLNRDTIPRWLTASN